MSQTVNCGLPLACNVPAGLVDGYLWYVADSAAASAAQRAAVALELAAGLVPTGYALRTSSPTARAGPYIWPLTLWAFVVALGSNGAGVMGTDTLVKDVEG